MMFINGLNYKYICYIQVIDITLKMLEIHEKYADLFITCARESTRTGAPIIRPLWWVDPLNDVSQTVDDEFLVGDDLLVAPVVHKGVTSRHVYLPPGRWRCELTGTELDGGRWYKDFEAAINQLPHFTRIK